MTERFYIGPYLVLESTGIPFDWKKYPASSEAEARQIAMTLPSPNGIEPCIYRYVADDECYTLIEDVCSLCGGSGTCLWENGPGPCACVRRKEAP